MERDVKGVEVGDEVREVEELRRRLVGLAEELRERFDRRVWEEYCRLRRVERGMRR